MVKLCTEHQMDKLLPRCALRSYVSLSIKKYRLCFAVKQISKSFMVNHSQDKEDEMGHKKERISDEIMPHLLNFLENGSDKVISVNKYGSCATPQDFEIYAPDASFEDPLMCAHGVKQIKSSFYSLAKVFSESKIVEYSIEENVISSGKLEILIDNKQQYKFLGRNIDVISLIKLDVQNGKVVRHEDWWDKKPLWNKETVKLPLVGRIVEMTRRGSMLATHAMMRFGKDPTM